MYLDSSVIVKVLVNEPDSAQWQARVESAADPQTSTLSVIELRSALRRKTTLGIIAAVEARQLWQNFQRDLETGQLTLLPLHPPVLDEAVRILENLPDSVALRALDALHLASAQADNSVPLATNDARMRAAAEALGIPLI